jgi:hypothetical protein
MDQAEFLKALGRILGADGDVEPLTPGRKIEPKFWDSIEILETIELVDRAGVTVEPADIRACTTVDALLQLAGLAATPSADEPNIRTH